MGDRTVTEWAPPIPKVTALITRPGSSGPELLVFDHGLAGIQLPAGTVEVGENLPAGVLREAWEETGALGLELVRELAVVRRQLVGRAGAVTRDITAAGRAYSRGSLLNIVSVDDREAATQLWDGTPVDLATVLIARSEERHIFHLRATVEMPDEWLVVTPDGGGSEWSCFWAPIDEAHAMVHEYQRDWLDAARPTLDESAARDPRPRARLPLPPEFDGVEVFEQFHAPPFGGRLVVLAVVEACDPEACTRAHGICVTGTGEIVLVCDEDGRWDVPGGGKEVGETTVETFAREVWEEACARVVDSQFLCGLRFVELDEDGGVHHEGLHAQMWARVELEDWNPQFETTQRRLVSPDEAVDLCVFSNVTRLLMARAARGDPVLVWEPERG